MTQIKIQPWLDEADQGGSYMKKLTTLSNFNSRENLRKISIKKKILSDEVIETLKSKQKVLSTLSAGTTMQNFNKTNRSEYRHRVTRLVFNDNSNKKYKFQPETKVVKKRIGLKNSHKLLKMLPPDISKDQQISLKKPKRQIYYNLTQVNSSLNTSIKMKCITQSATEEKHTRKIKLLEKININKFEQRPLYRQLSVQRKIFVLQSGQKINKQLILQNKTKRKQKNIIEEICKVQRQYERQRKKL